MWGNFQVINGDAFFDRGSCLWHVRILPGGEIGDIFLLSGDYWRIKSLENKLHVL